MLPNQVRFLIVDDEDYFREALADLFRLYGFDVETAANGAEALERMAKRTFHLILTDLVMPEMNGIEFLARLKNFPISQNVFVTSGYSTVELPDIFDAGALGFLSKPVDAAAVKDLLTTALLHPESQWTRPFFSQNIYSTHRKIKSLHEAEKTAELQFGRGGFFMSLKTNLPAVGTGIKFQIDIGDADPVTLVSGQGIIRWVRPVGTQLLPAGIGVEIKQLGETCRKAFTQWILQQNNRAFIPKGQLTE